MAAKIINAEGLILGRLASVVAKRLLNGEEIIVTNAEKAIVIGSRDNIMEQYIGKRARTHARKGPHFPRMPDRILKRTVRGMLPYQQPRGRTALKNLKVFIGVPKEYQKSKAETVKQAQNIDNEKYLELGEVARNLGARFIEY